MISIMSNVTRDKLRDHKCAPQSVAIKRTMRCNGCGEKDIDTLHVRCPGCGSVDWLVLVEGA